MYIFMYTTVSLISYCKIKRVNPIPLFFHSCINQQMEQQKSKHWLSQDELLLKVVALVFSFQVKPS